MTSGKNPTTAETRVNATMINSIFQAAFPGGYYVLGIISNDSSAAQGAVTYYQMTAEQLAALKSYMMSDTFLTEQELDLPTVTDVIPAEILKTLYDDIIRGREHELLHVHYGKHNQ